MRSVNFGFTYATQKKFTLQKKTAYFGVIKKRNRLIIIDVDISRTYIKAQAII
jgi:hypothetical protein